AEASTYTQWLDSIEAAVNQARDYNGPLGEVSVVSMSFGLTEDNFTASELAACDAVFTTPANHIGMTFVASAGDDGAGIQQRYPNNVAGDNGFEPPEYPASSPNVIGVGGTSLIFPAGSTSFAYPGVATTPGGVGESAWGAGSQSYDRYDTPGGGSGGGISQWESEPTYQTDYGLHYSNGSFNARTTPDVSLLADPNQPGVWMYDVSGFHGEGGTSFSAPAWAALIAIADEARAANNEGSLDGRTQTLPDLYQLSGNDFHDITQGSDGYSAGPGYDLATGLGTPIASRVVGDLWGQAPPVANDDSYSVTAGTTLTVSAANGVLVNDTDPMGEPLTVSTFTQPANGSVTVYQDGSFTYQPDSNFTGNDSFTYTILDTGTGVGSTAAVHIAVTNGLPDLAPYTPSGWSGPLVVSTQSGDTSTGTAITTADTVYIDWAFLNQGNTAITTPFQTELLLDGTQVHTWSADVPLDPSFYTYVTDFSLGQLSAGSHTVTVVADYLDQVTESNKNNNTVSYTFTVTQPALPDLAPYTPSGWSGPLVVSTQSGDTISASAFTPSDTVYIDWAFVNLGAAAINNPFGVELLLDGSQVQTWSPDVPLNANQYTYVTDYSLGQLAVGTHTVTVVADYLNQVTESNKNNNTESYTFTVTQPPLPDLAPYTPSGWSGPLLVTTMSGSTTTATTVSTTNNVYIDWAFINQGNAPINTAYQFELLLDGTVVTTWSGALPLDANFYTYVTDYSLGQLTAGSHTVTVIADDLDQVTESNKNNNTESYTFTVTQSALPDLAPYTPSGWSGPLVVSTESGNTISASTITTADTLYIDWAFINQGTVPINNAFGVELLLDGEEVQTWSAGIPLDPNYYTHIQDFDLGQLSAGSHTVTVVADYLNQVSESNKNNNTETYTFTVAQPPLPDLAPYTPSGWSGPLVVSTEQGDTTTATTITTTSTIYIDWAFINQGNASIDTTFHTELLLDGKQVTTWYTNPPLGPTIYAFVTDFRLGLLTAGSHTVTVVANYLDEVTESDQTNNTESYTFTVTAPPPPAPTVNSIPNQTVTGGQSVMVTASATGPAGDSLQYGLVDNPPSWATINLTTGVITLQPPTSVSGAFVFDVTATDTTTEETSSPQPIAVIVDKPPPPAVNSIADQTVTGGQSVTVTAGATGPAGDPLQYGLADNPPSWATINATTGVITLQPPTSVSGGFIIDVTATDTTTQETSSPQPMAVTVAKPPPPTFNSISNQTVTGGQSVTVTATATGPSGDPLQYGLTNSPPSWATINATTGVITLNPPTSVSGGFIIDVTATDTTTQESSTPQSMAVTVDKPLIPPQIGSIQPVNLSSGQTKTVHVSVNDVIGDPLRFSLNNAPSWISIDPSSGAIMVSPPISVGGSFSVTVLATDEVNPDLAGSQTFTANIKGVPPQIIGASTSGSAKGTTAVTLHFSEPMNPNSAGNSGNYIVKVSSSAKGKATKSLGILAHYNGSNNSVTLTLSKTQKFHIEVTVSGLFAANGARMGSAFTRMVQ
ncbi:MAG: CARDB domain-containing protein, partial [Isosphaeraceae bacterium]